MKRDLALAVALSLFAGPAIAQSMDYGTLEQIFGQPVTTSATGSPKLASDVPVPMEIITAEDIRRSGATDIPTILSRAAGLEVWRWSLDAADVSVRGYNRPFSPRLLVLINGRQVYLDHYGMTNWATLPVELAEIRQIEVVKGPNTALFGFNAVAGVVNIITVNPLRDTVDSATVRTGSQDYREASLVKTQHLSDRAGVRVSLGGHTAEEFDTPLPASEASLRFGPRRGSVSVDGLAQVSDDAQLGVELTRTYTRQTGFFVFYTPVEMVNDIRSAKLTYTTETGLGLVEATVYRSWTDGTIESDIIPFMPIANQVTIARLQDLFKLGSGHSLRLAGEYRHNMLHNVSGSSTDIGYDIYAASGMWDWAITNRLSWTNGVRLDHLQLGRDGTAHTRVPEAVEPFTNADYDRDITEYSFNSGLVYKVSDLDTLRLMVGRGIQAPSLHAMGFIQSEHYPGGIIAMASGSPDLDPSVIMNYEASWDRALPSLDSTVRLGAFYQTTDNLMTTPEAASPSSVFIPPNQITLLSANIGQSRSWGLEAGLKGKIGANWRWGLNYTYEIVDDDLTVNRSGTIDIPVFNEDTAARHRVNTRLGYTAGPFEADLYAGFASSYRMPRGIYPLLPDNYYLRDVPAQLILDGRLGYHLTDHLTVALEGQSINQAEYRPTSGPALERRLFLSLRADF